MFNIPGQSEPSENSDVFQEIDLAFMVAARYTRWIKQAVNNLQPGFAFEFYRNESCQEQQENLRQDLLNMDFEHLEVFSRQTHIWAGDNIVGVIVKNHAMVNGKIQPNPYRWENYDEQEPY